MLPTPGFHHLRLNPVDPQAAIDFYARLFPRSTSKTQFGGAPALAANNNVLVLFEKVASPPAQAPETAFWHFGWYVAGARASLAIYRDTPGVNLMPLYTSDAGGFVHISSDALPGVDGVLGRTRSQLADGQAKGVQPKGGAGFVYMRGGPDSALFEIAGDYPEERFNHIHNMWQYDPFCAQLWYQEHLNAPSMEGRASPIPMTPANCKVPRGPDTTWPSLDLQGTYRTPRAAVVFGDVALAWYAPQSDVPLADPRGHLIDHVGLSVTDLDAWIDKLKREEVRFLSETYAFAGTRAVMIEGPSGERLELIDVRA